MLPVPAVCGIDFYQEGFGRREILIWQCSAQLIFRKPVLGYGGNGFTANYMNEQAAYFTRHPGSKYAMLADNVCWGVRETVGRL